MTTPLDITDFVYNTGTLTIAAGDTTAVFSGTSLSANIKDGDTLCAGGVKVPIKTVTDDTHVELFTAWDGTAVTGGTYIILKDSMLRNNAVQIGYDTAAFLSFLDNTTIWYVVDGTEPDPSVGEDTNRALKTNVTPWKQWLKTGGIWVEQAGSPGGPGADGADGATILVQDGEPDLDHTAGSLWIDSDSVNIDVYLLGGSPLAWEDTGMNLKGTDGVDGDTGPSPLKPIEAWVTATAYVTGPPASFVNEAGSAYECLIAHTSGTFATDLAAGKWGLVAAKGTDGTGVGDVVGPSSAVDSHIVLFDTISGKAIKDSGKAVSDFATATQGAKADSALQNASAFATASQGTKADSAVQSIVQGTNITVDATDPRNPIISSTGASSTDRQNAALDLIYQSKLAVGVRRVIKAAADGYKSSVGVNSGSSSNYTVDTTNGRWTPSSSGGADESTSAFAIANGSFSGFPSSNAFDNSTSTRWVSAQTAVNQSGTSWIGQDFGAGNAKNIVSITIRQTNDATQNITSIKVQYSSDNSTWNDATTATILTGTTAVQAVAFSSVGSFRYWRIIANANVTTSGNGWSIDEIEFISAVANNNATVVSVAQTVSSSVSNARVLIEYDPIDAITLNTDLTVDVTCNGGTNWAAATLALAGSGQDGRSVAETADTSCTSGTSFAARFKTANNKMVRVYGFSITVH